MESSTQAPEEKKLHWKVKQKMDKERGNVDDSKGPVENIDLPAGVESEKPVDDEYNIEVIKDYHGNIDPFYLSKKDPRYEYRFLRFDDKNLSVATGNLLFNGGGWQLCSKEHLLRIGVSERFIGPDNLYHVGDTVLAFIPKKLYQEKMSFEKKKAEDWNKSIQRTLEKGDSSIGGSEIHESMKGIQTEKELNASRWR